jgi:hypothetical protein
MGKYVFQDNVKVLKLTIVKQRIVPVFITLTPRRRNEFFDYQQVKVRISELLIMDGMTRCNLRLELLK